MAAGFDALVAREAVERDVLEVERLGAEMFLAEVVVYQVVQAIRLAVITQFLVFTAVGRDEVRGPNERRPAMRADAVKQALGVGEEGGT